MTSLPPLKAALGSVSKPSTPRERIPMYRPSSIEEKDNHSGVFNKNDESLWNKVNYLEQQIYGMKEEIMKSLYQKQESDRHLSLEMHEKDRLYETKFEYMTSKLKETLEFTHTFATHISDQMKTTDNLKEECMDGLKSNLKNQYEELMRENEVQKKKMYVLFTELTRVGKVVDGIERRIEKKVGEIIEKQINYDGMNATTKEEIKELRDLLNSAKRYQNNREEERMEQENEIHKQLQHMEKTMERYTQQYVETQRETIEDRIKNMKREQEENTRKLEKVVQEQQDRTLVLSSSITDGLRNMDEKFREATEKQEKEITWLAKKEGENIEAFIAEIVDEWKFQAKHRSDREEYIYNRLSNMEKATVEVINDLQNGVLGVCKQIEDEKERNKMKRKKLKLLMNNEKKNMETVKRSSQEAIDSRFKSLLDKVKLLEEQMTLNHTVCKDLRMRMDSSDLEERLENLKIDMNEKFQKEDKIVTNITENMKWTWSDVGSKIMKLKEETETKIQAGMIEMKEEANKNVEMMRSVVNETTAAEVELKKEMMQEIQDLNNQYDLFQTGKVKTDEEIRDTIGEVRAQITGAVQTLNQRLISSELQASEKLTALEESVTEKDKKAQESNEARYCELRDSLLKIITVAKEETNLNLQQLSSETREQVTMTYTEIMQKTAESEAKSHNDMDSALSQISILRLQNQNEHTILRTEMQQNYENACLSFQEREQVLNESICAFMHKTEKDSFDQKNGLEEIKTEMNCRMQAIDDASRSTTSDLRQLISSSDENSQEKFKQMDSVVLEIKNTISANKEGLDAVFKQVEVHAGQCTAYNEDQVTKVNSSIQLLEDKLSDQIKTMDHNLKLDIEKNRDEQQRIETSLGELIQTCETRSDEKLKTIEETIQKVETGMREEWAKALQTTAESSISCSNQNTEKLIKEMEEKIRTVTDGIVGRITTHETDSSVANEALKGSVDNSLKLIKENMEGQLVTIRTEMTKATDEKIALVSNRLEEIDQMSKLKAASYEGTLKNIEDKLSAERKASDDIMGERINTTIAKTTEEVKTTLTANFTDSIKKMEETLRQLVNEQQGNLDREVGTIDEKIAKVLEKDIVETKENMKNNADEITRIIAKLATMQEKFDLTLKSIEENISKSSQDRLTELRKQQDEERKAAIIVFEKQMKDIEENMKKELVNLQNKLDKIVEDVSKETKKQVIDNEDGQKALASMTNTSMKNMQEKIEENIKAIQEEMKKMVSSSVNDLSTQIKEHEKKETDQFEALRTGIEQRLKAMEEKTPIEKK